MEQAKDADTFKETAKRSFIPNCATVQQFV